MTDFRGTNVLVTGASSGIGRAVAAAFSAHGAGVVLTGRDHARLRSAAREAAAMGGRVHAIAADLRRPAQIERLIRGARKELGRIDIAVLCAGVPGPVARASTKIAKKDWEETLAVNFAGVREVASALLRESRGRRPSRILVATSVAGTRGFAGLGPYVASKFALRGWFECLSRELDGASTALTALELGTHATRMTRGRLPAKTWRQLDPPEAAVPFFLAIASAAPAAVHGRVFSEMRFRADADAELQLGSSLATVRPWTPHLPRYESRTRQDAIDLDLLENPCGPSPDALRVLRESLTPALSRYPDPQCSRLRAALAARLGVERECLAFGIGSSELVERALRTFAIAGDEVVSTDPTWPVFERFCRALGLQDRKAVFSPALELPVASICDAVTPRTRLVYLVNPNNPLGTLLSRDALEELLARLPPGLPLVVDEAYVEYSRAEDVLPALVRTAARPLLGLRTFSKFHGLAGLRLGYAFGSPRTIGFFRRLEAPYGISSPVEAAAIAALGDRSHAERTLALVESGRARIAAEAARLGLRSFPSSASYVMVESPADPATVFGALLDAGIHAPEVAWNGLLQIPVGAPGETERHLAALARLR